jgi:hypothetical protein
MISTGSPDHDHFRRLAAKGAFRGASTYERLSFLIVEAVGKAACGMDGAALRGLVEFVEVARDAPEVVSIWAEAIARAGDFRR